MARLLIVHHSPTEKTRALFSAVHAGATHELIEGVDVRVRHALEATSADLLDADAVIFGTTANFGYISGALKHFFDSTFNETHEQTSGRPFSFWIHGGYDTTGAENAMRSITTGYGLQLAAEPLIFTGDVEEAHLSLAEELGATVAASLT